MVHEVIGDSRQAADCYRKVIDFIRQHPDDYDATIAEQFVTQRTAESLRASHLGTRHE
jgi:hypothetical protein